MQSSIEKDDDITRVERKSFHSLGSHVQAWMSLDEEPDWSTGETNHH